MIVKLQSGSEPVQAAAPAGEDVVAADPDGQHHFGRRRDSRWSAGCTFRRTARDWRRRVTPCAVAHFAHGQLDGAAVHCAWGRRQSVVPDRRLCRRKSAGRSPAAEHDSLCRSGLAERYRAARADGKFDGDDIERVVAGKAALAVIVGGDLERDATLWFPGKLVSSGVTNGPADGPQLASGNMATSAPRRTR